MAKRIIELSKTVNETVEDDYIMIDSVSEGVRKILLKDIIPEGVDMNLFKEIEMTMPEPGTMEENTANLQKCLDVAKDIGINIRVKFRPGIYELSTCIIYSNTHIILSDNTELKHVLSSYNNPTTGQEKIVPILFLNAKPFDTNDSKIIEYQGRSNIHFEGGIIDSYSPFLFCHGTNILVENVYMKNADYEHFVQLAACKNVTLKNCIFEGMKSPSSGKNYVEYVHITYMNESYFPYWTSTSKIFDTTINDTIIIDNCIFRPGTGNYQYFKAGVGTHDSNNGKNQNITIRNCTFEGYEFAALNLRNMYNVNVENNIYKTGRSTESIFIINCDTVNIHEVNDINGGGRGINCVDSSKIKIDGVSVDNMNVNNNFLFFGDSQDLIIKDITIRNSHSNLYNIECRNVTDFTAIGCRDINTDNNLGYFFHIYDMNGGHSSRITIKDTITDKIELYATDDCEDIISDREEEIWSAGSIYSGSFVLDKDPSKYKNKKVYLHFYGKTVVYWNFINNDMLIREVNIPDDTSTGNTSINFLEFCLTYDKDTNTMNIKNNNQLTIRDGVSNAVTSNAYIYKITGERIRY